MRIIHWSSGTQMSSEFPISDLEPDPGLLGPDSLTWRLHEEQWLIMAVHAAGIDYGPVKTYNRGAVNMSLNKTNTP